MFKKFIATAMAVLLPASLLAQTYPSPTYNNVTIQGNLNLPSETANKVMVSPDGVSGVPDFRVLVTGDIPSLAASKITSGTFADARIPSLDAAKIATGTFDPARIPFLDASKVNTGIFADARIPSLAISKTTGLQTALDAKAPLASPVLTGTPTAPTATVGTNTDQIATTAFVLANNSPNFPSQTANTVFAGPNGSAGLPSFRAMVAADVPVLDAAKITSGTFNDARIPSLDAAKIATGTLPVARGGTGVTTATGSGSVMLNNNPLVTNGLKLDGAAGTVKDLVFTTSNTARWIARSNPTAESGSNAGSDFEINRRDDTGAAIGTAFFIRRSNGQVGINTTAPTESLTVSGNARITGNVTALADANITGNVNISGLVGGNRRISLQSVGSDRWYIRPSAEAETGANAGSNFEITRRDDTGNGLGTPFFIERATGEIGINTITPGSTLDVNGTLNVSNGATFAGNGILGNVPSNGYVVSGTGVTSYNINSSGQSLQSFAINGVETLRLSSNSATSSNSISSYSATYPLTFNVNGAERFRINPDGTGVFASIPTAPTATVGDNDTSVATTAFVAANKGVADLRDYGGSCNGAGLTALTNAQTWANIYGAPIQVSCVFSIASSITVSADIQFIGGGRFDVASGATVTFTGNITADTQQNDMFGGAGSVDITNADVKEVSVCWWGACDGSADVADNIRKVVNSGVSGKNIVFPALNYNLCTAVPVGTGAGQVGYPATNQSSVVFKQLSDFKVEAEGATFTTCATIAQNIAFLMDRNTDWQWDGGDFVGSRSGLSTSTVNAPFQLMNNERFTLKNTRAVSGYTDAGAFFEGDGNIDFVIEDNVGTVGQGIDMAFSRNAMYRNNVFIGASTDGNNIGLKGFSHIYDGPLVSPTNYIYSGVTQSENIKLDGNRFENYVSGVVIQEGKHWQVHNNYLLNIKGLGASPAAGVLINYVPSGSFANVGHTPINISIQGNQIDGLGTTVAGCGVNIGANAIANGDVFNRMIMSGNMISGSAGSTGFCADTNSTAKIANIFIGINEYSNIGALLNTNMSTHAKPATLPR